MAGPEYDSRSNVVIPTRQPGLPGGVNQRGCDGRFDPCADADVIQLWHACQPDQQQEIADRFAVSHADGLRDALLEAQDALRNARATGKNSANILAKAIWREWSAYRDRSIEDLLRRGRLRLDSSSLNGGESPCPSRI